MKAVQGKKKNKAANFVIQGSILAMAGILVRIIGMLYRMPLNDIIGKQGNGYYTSAYNVYNILLILSSYSMPVAIKNFSDNQCFTSLFQKLLDQLYSHMIALGTAIATNQQVHLMIPVINEIKEMVVYNKLYVMFIRHGLHSLS